MRNWKLGIWKGNPIDKKKFDNRILSLDMCN